jgi:CDK-activating kinase assembly factor MAT1
MERVCPRCRTSSYDKPSLKLLVNVCGHHICESCVDVVFARPTAPCPECGVALRRSLYRAQQFEDPMVEREVDIRKKVLQDYNQLEGDFPSLQAYNDYLEEVETIVYNLCNGVDVEATREKMERYRRDHQTLIMKNREKRRQLERLTQQEVREEQQLQELRNRQALASAKGEAREKKRDMQSVIHELVRCLNGGCVVVGSMCDVRWCQRDQRRRWWPATQLLPLSLSQSPPPAPSTDTLPSLPSREAWVQQCLTCFQAQRRGRTIPTSLPVRICSGLESLISKN